MLVTKRLKGCAVSTKTILRMKGKAAMEKVNTKVSLETAETQLDKSFKEYKAYIKDAAKKRVHFQFELAAAKAKEGNIKAAEALKNMVRIEAQRASAMRIKRMNGKMHNSNGLTRAIAPNKEGEWVEVNDKESMEEALRMENSRRFTQANDTPLMRGRIYNELGVLPPEETTKSLLHGTYIVPHDTSPGVQEVLNYLK